MNIFIEETPYIKQCEISLQNGINGLMGSSGCGKTTLMNEIFKKYDNIGYLSQDAPLFDFLTIQENIFISLQILGKENESEKMIENMELTKCKDTLIKSVSGGERKRCSIAIEMCNDPCAFLFDEPLSSLDSSTSISIFKFIQTKLSHLPILLSIHQPSGIIFFNLDSLILMTNGTIIYSGSPSSVETHFTYLGHKMNNFSSVPEFIIELCQELNEQQIKDYAHKDTDTVLLIMNQAEPKKQGSLWNKALICIPLVKREFLQNFRNPMFFKVRIFQTIVFSCFVGILFFQMKNDQIGVQNKNGALFFIIINQIMSNTFSTIQTFPQSLKNFNYDYQRKKYPLINYYIVKTSIDIPFQIFNTALFGLLSVYITDITDKIFQFVSILVVIALTAASFGYFLSTLSKDTNVSLVITNLFILPMMLTSGFFMNNNSVPVYIEWIQHINPFYYGYNSLSNVVWKDIDIECSEDCLYANGKEVLEYQNIKPNNNFIILLCMIGVFRALGYLSLLLRNLKE